MNAVLNFAAERRDVRTQKDFAAAIDMPADRLRNIVNGKVKNLRADEARVIEDAFGVRSAWWFSDSAPMLLTDDEVAARPVMLDLRNATAETMSLGLSGRRATFVQEVLFHVRTKNAAGLQGVLDRASDLLPTDEQAVLESYRRCEAPARAELIQTAALAAAGISRNGGVQFQGGGNAYVGHQSGGEVKVRSNKRR